MSGVQTKEIVSFGPPPESPYSTAVKADGLIYLSGTLADDAADADGGSLEANSYQKQHCRQG